MQLKACKSASFSKTWNSIFSSGLKRLLFFCELVAKHIALVPYGCMSIFLAAAARFWPRPVDIGIGPEPLINQRCHKLACIAAGYSAETFATHLFYYSNDFDYIARQGFLWRCLLAWRCLFRYRALYFYFKGGPFAWTGLLRLEPWIYKISGTRTLVTGYGGDCQDWNHCPNYLFKHAMNRDYPHVCRKNHRTRQRIDRWTLHADHILSGCDWVDYTPRWDTLCTAHFTVDVHEITPPDPAFPLNQGTLTVLHAPNHTEIKGSCYFIQAVEELKQEGYDLELQFVQNTPNTELKEMIRKADIVADQLIVGWHGMFAVEGMSAGKPVLCYLRDDLLELFEFAGVLAPGEIPLINCTRHTVKDRLRELLNDREQIASIGKRSREYVVRRHSIDAMGQLFGAINQKMGIYPRQPRAKRLPPSV